jgi:hypothetical protein
MAFVFMGLIADSRVASFIAEAICLQTAKCVSEGWIESQATSYRAEYGTRINETMTIGQL